MSGSSLANFKRQLGGIASAKIITSAESNVQQLSQINLRYHAMNKPEADSVQPAGVASSATHQIISTMQLMQLAIWLEPPIA